MFSQSSHVGGVGSGAGALRYGAATNQTGNLLDTDTHIEGPRILVGKSDHPGGARKKRFGVTGSADLFNYPDLMVRGNGPNGQAYKQSVPGYLPGNGQDGFAGYGARDPHDFTFTEAADLTLAKEIAHREADQLGHFVQPEHMMYKDRTAESMKERFQDQDKEREKAILQAEKMPYSQDALMKAQLAQMLPDQQREDFSNTSVAPGGIARRQDATAIERALNTGNPVAMKKKMQAIRHEQRIQGQVKYVEPATVIKKAEHHDVANLMMRLAKKEHGTAEEHDTHVEQAHHLQQSHKERQLDRQHAAMLKAFAKT